MVKEAKEYTYDRQLADIYEHSPFFGRGSEDRVRFYAEEAAAAGGPVLEIGAATGLYTIALARAGLAVEAMDISPEMLDFVRERLAAEPPEVRKRVTLHQDDMREFRLNTKFATAVLPGNALLAATTIEDQLRTLRSVHRHLVDGGTLILDVFSPDRNLIAQTKEHSWCEFTIPHTGDRYLSHRYTQVEPLQQLLKIRFIHERLDEDGGLADRRMHTIQFRYIYPNELRLLLLLAGFRIRRYYGDFTSRTTKSAYDGHQVVIAEKMPARNR